MTCCALHNLLLDVDGLSHKWTDGVASSYENDDGEFQDEDIPAAIRRLVDPTGTESHRLRTLDDSRFGMGLTDCDLDDIGTADSDLNHRSLQLPLVRSGTSVKSINFTQFRAMLIDSFNIAFHKNELKWPRRFPKESMPVEITSSRST